MDRQKIVVVQAHPDDELLWAWPVMQRPDLFDIMVVFGCANGQSYPKAMEAARAFADLSPLRPHEVFRHAGVTNSNYYRQPTRPYKADLSLCTYAKLIQTVISVACDEHGTDLVWTHNPVGEYGHGDHRLLWELVCTTPGVNQVLYSDICLKNKSHISYDRLPRYLSRLCYAGRQVKDRPFYGGRSFSLDGEQKLDLDWFNEGKQVYQDHRAWSWNNPVPETCNVYCIDL